MKNSSTLVRRILVSAILLASTSIISFGQNYPYNVKQLLDTIIKNPEYSAEAVIIKQLRKDGKKDEWILKYMDDNYGKPRAMKAKQPKPHAATHKDLYLSSSCNNNDIGVEAGNFATWQGELGNLNSTGSGPPCQAAPFASTPLPVVGRIEIVSSSTPADPCADVPGFPINLPAPTGGQYSIKLGNMQINAETERIIHQFVVTPQDTNFIYNYAVVFEDPGHLPSNQPFFDFVILGPLGDTVPCSFQHYVGGNVPGFQTSSMGPSCPGSGLSTVYYKPWTTVGVHLGAYVNQQVTVICTTGDCSQCGHFGLAYLDFSCGTSSPAQYCISSTGVVLVAPIEPGATYSWSTGSTNDSITVNPQLIDTVILTVLLPGGCDYVIPYVLQPTVMNSGFTHTVTCNSATFTDTTFITGGNIASWLWTFQNGTPSTSTSQNPGVISFPPGGTYSVTLQTTSQAGCADTSVTVFVTIPPAPIVNAGLDQTICTGSGAVQLCGSGAVSYVWQPGGLSTSCITVTPPSSPFTYSLTATDANGCTGTDQVKVTTNPLPNVNAGPPKTICLGQSTAQLNGTTNATAPTYSWVPGTGLSNTTISNPIANPGFSNTYTLYVTDGNGCSSFATTTVSVGALPYVSAIASPTICVGDSAILNANTSSGLPPYSYYWTPTVTLNNASLQNPTAGPPTTTTYTVYATDANGCWDDTTTTVTVQTIPSISFSSWTPDLTCDGYIIPWKANVSSNGQSVFWDFGDGSTLVTYAPNTNAGPHSYPFNGTYNVVAIVFNGQCTDTVDTTLIVADLTGFLTIGPANVFTPNNDGDNDCFVPVFIPQAGSGISPDTLESLQECLYLEVWDRWGVKMFSTSETEKCWKGTNMKGTPVKDGTYYYVAKFGEEIVKGHVALLRKTN